VGRFPGADPSGRPENCSSGARYWGIVRGSGRSDLGIFGQRQSDRFLRQAAFRSFTGAGLNSAHLVRGFRHLSARTLRRSSGNPDGLMGEGPRDSSVHAPVPSALELGSVRRHRGEFAGWAHTAIFTDEEFARPGHGLHSRYGCVAMTYPDGRLSAGYRGRRWRSAEIAASWTLVVPKDVLGRVTFEYNYNALGEPTATDTLQPRGPITGSDLA